MLAQAIQGYHTTEITTADRVRLVVLCYEGCIANAVRAKEAIEEGCVAKKSEYIGKASSIVSELMYALDMERGGEIAQRLQMLYQYVLRELSQANLKNDPCLVDNALRVLRELKIGWDTIVRKGPFI